MFQNFFLFLLTSLGLLLTQCGPGSSEISGKDEPDLVSPPSENTSSPVIASTGTPFDGLSTGDDFSWGFFINKDGPYLTTRVGSLPMPVYPVFFSDDELQAIEEGIEIANTAVGFEVFELVDKWSNDARPIYKVGQVEFGSPTQNESFLTVGYTYSRNVYPEGKYDAGRVVTDWGMELMDDHVTQWVVAHELGHAMGIQKHSLIDYDNDTVEPLKPDALMNAVIPENPSLDEYNYMMAVQGEILLRDKNRL